MPKTKKKPVKKVVNVEKILTSIEPEPPRSPPKRIRLPLKLLKEGDWFQCGEDDFPYKIIGYVDKINDGGAWVINVTKGNKEFGERQEAALEMPVYRTRPPENLATAVAASFLSKEGGVKQKKREEAKPKIKTKVQYDILGQKITVGSSSVRINKHLTEAVQSVERISKASGYPVKKVSEHLTFWRKTSATEVWKAKYKSKHGKSPEFCVEGSVEKGFRLVRIGKT